MLFKVLCQKKYDINLILGGTKNEKTHLENQKTLKTFQISRVVACERKGTFKVGTIKENIIKFSFFTETMTVFLTYFFYLNILCMNKQCCWITMDILRVVDKYNSNLELTELQRMAMNDWFLQSVQKKWIIALVF